MVQARTVEGVPTQYGGRRRVWDHRPGAQQGLGWQALICRYDDPNAQRSAAIRPQETT